MAATILLGMTNPIAGAESYLVFDVDTGEILLSENADSQRQIASLTKVATAIIVLEWVSSTAGDLEEKMEVSSRALLGGANQMQLVAGDKVTVGGALHAAMMASDNTSAAVLAEYIGNLLPSSTSGENTTGVFVEKMNELAARLGMKDTRFINPHGLDLEAEQGISTAYDVALLTRYALGIPGLLEFCSKKEIVVQTERGGSPREVLVTNTNQLIGKNGIDGMKTGTTRRSGPCLIATAVREGETGGDGQQVRLASVLLGSVEDRFTRTESLLGQAFSRVKSGAAGHSPDAGKEYLRKPAN